MIGVLLLALLVLGITLTLHGVASLVRGRRPPTPAGASDPSAVAVLIAVHDEADLVAHAVRAAARLVPLANVHVVSDASTDGTADVARECGVQVAETMGSLGRAAAVDGAIQAFRLVDRFEFVILLDAGTVLDGHYLDEALPLFADRDVVAVDGRLDLDLRSAPTGFAGRLLSAYRSRNQALAEGVRQHRRGGTPLNVGRVVPSVGRIYRASALWEIDIHSSGLAIDDFDTTLRIYRQGFGTVAYCPTARVAPAEPMRLRDHRRRMFLWGNGFWRAARGHGLRDLPQAAQTVEVGLASLALLLAPVAIVAAAVPGLLPVSPWALLAAVLVPDYLLTLTVALARRTPAILLPGLLFPALRVLDAAILLRSWWGRPAADEWLRFTGATGKAPAGTEPVDRPEPAVTGKPRAGKLRPASVLAWFILVGSAAVVAARVALTAGTLPATRIEPVLVDATFAKVSGLGAPPVDGSLRILGLQLDAYATVTGAFGRHAGTLASARELSVVSVFAMLIGLVVVAALLRVRPLVMTVAVLMLAVSGPVITVLTPVGPGVTAAAWTALAAAAGLATVRRRDARWVAAGLLALLLALATAPVLVVPIGIGGAVWFALADNRPPTRVWTAALALVASAGVALLCLRAGLLAAPDTEAFLTGTQRALLLAVVVAAALAGLVVAWLRPAAAATATGAVLVAVAAPGADAVLPALVLTTATLVALVVDGTIGRFPLATPARIRWGTAALASAAAIVGSAVGVVFAPESGRAVDHAGLAEWMAKNLDGETGLAAPAGLWSDLQRDRGRAGLPADAVRPTATARPDDLVAAVGPTSLSGVDLVRFGGEPTDPDSVIVLLTSRDEPYLSSNERAGAGGQLAENTRLDTTDEVRAALRAGQVDLRAMAVVAELCRARQVTVASTGKPPHERGTTLPDRTVVLSTADTESTAALLEWLKAQQPPFAPDEVRQVPGGIAVSWRLPPLHDRTPK